MDQAIEFARVADLYDQYVHTTIDIPFFLEEAAGVEGEVLELMSGTGRVSLPLVEAGVRLTCVDYSEEMLEQLRRKLFQLNCSADVFHVDVRELDLEKEFERIILPFNSFAELITREDQRRALDRIRQHLSPSGQFICTLHNPPARLKQVDGLLRLWGKYPQEYGTLLFWGMETYDLDKNLVSGVELFEVYNGKGLLTSKRMMEHRFRLTGKAEFEQMATSAGFSVHAFYGDYARTDFSEENSPFMIWILGT